jgi:hypothetical protein
MPVTLREMRDEFRQQIRQAITSRGDLSYAEIGAMFGVTSMTVWGVAREYGLRRKRGPKPKSRSAAQRSGLSQ